MFYINKHKVFILPYYRYKKNYWLAKTTKVEFVKGKRIFVFLAANYANLGDIAITYAQHRILQQWKPDYSIIEIPANCTYSYLKSVIKQIERNDIVTFVGGGNMGDMYPLFENFRQIIISELPENEIWQFPITADFSETTCGRMMLFQARKIYGSHKNLKILARETKTSDFLSKQLDRDIPVVPDIVLTLDYFKMNNTRSGISVCLRNDKERFLHDDDAELIMKNVSNCGLPIEVMDTLLDDCLITLENKEEFLNRYIEKLSTKSLLITDRLHGMIFAYITGTPAVVLPNSNQKVRNCYKWISNSGYIFFMDKFDENLFKKNIEQALLSKPNKQRFIDNQEKFTKEILRFL